MEINYYRQNNAQGYEEAWSSCQFTSHTDLSRFSVKPLVTINGQPYLRQHHVTYLTGRETCRAHHFAKHLAIQVLSQHQSCQAHGDAIADKKRPTTSSVLWIDTHNGPHVAAAIFRELSQHVATGNDLHYLCLDILGGQRDDHWWLNRHIEQLISSLQPQLVVIDDIDHFMPYCGPRVATEFKRAIRDAVNHTDTAFLFIGYNHTGKKTCTAGELGKQLFTSANDIFSLSTVREVTTVRHISGYDLHVLPDHSQFQFTIGPDNLPREATPTGKTAPSGIDDDTLRTIVDDINQPGHDITTTDLLAQVKARHSQLKRQTRDAALLDQIHRLHLLDPIPASNEVKEDNEVKEIKEDKSSKGSKAGPPCHGSAVATSQLPHDVNNSLTLPTHPQSVPACPVGGGSAAVKTPVHSGSAAVIPTGNQPCQAHINPCHDTAFCK